MFDETTLNERHGKSRLKDDAAFIAVEHKITELERQGAEIMAAGAGDYPAEITIEIADLREQIAQSPPISLASATIKLRDLLRPEVGLAALGSPGSERECDIPSLRQVLAFLEGGRGMGAPIEADAADALEVLTHAYSCPSGNDPGALKRILGTIDSIAPSGVDDPIPALVAERWRHEADAAAKYNDRDEDAFARHLEAVDKLDAPIDRRVADTVASSVAGVTAQVWLLREMLFDDPVDDERNEQLFRSIVIGIMRLGSGAP